MDIQYIGEKSSVLNWYITKYTTKSERSHATTAFLVISLQISLLPVSFGILDLEAYLAKK